MKSVDINGRFLTQATTGVQRAALELVRALDHQLAASPALRNRYSFRLVTPGHHDSRLALGHIPVVRVGHLRGHAWEQLELPIYARGRLLLNLCNTAPLAVPTLATIYDASVFAVPEAYSPAFRAWYRTLIPLLGKRALRIITVSRFSRGELSQRAGIPLSKMDLMPLGAEHILGTPADSAIFGRVPVEPGRFILAVGSRSPHKNVGAVRTAVSRLGTERLPLVVAGGSNPRVFGGEDSAHGADDFHAAGYVSDGELRALYENATCLVYPSLYEGFGFPPLEAMLCGCPAVVASAASLPEVCGNGALFCNPRDPDDIAGKIRLLIQDARKRQELRQRGMARAKGFTWDRASQALLGLIERIQPA
jgi:glycosyltransferase involved in cell wall biosynthesis